MSQVVLIYPPVSKPGEVPLGVARLKSTLSHSGISCTVTDANLDGLHFLLSQPILGKDKWTRDAASQIQSHLEALKQGTAFRSIDHYNRIVRDLGRVLQYQGKNYHAFLGLADFGHPEWSLAKSDDLLASAERPESNPFFPYYHDQLLPFIMDENPEMIGLSVQFLSQAFCAFALLGLIRRTMPHVRLVVGGGLITSWMQLSSWHDPFHGLLDYCVSGPGEPFFLSYFRKTESICFPTPDLSSFQTERALSPGVVLPYNTSTGCFWRQCRFCPECAEGNAYIPVPQNRVLEDLTHLCQRHSPSLIHFLDNALAPSLLKQIVQTPFSAPWYGYVRFHSDLLDVDFCRELRASGCVMLKLGLESGDQEVLDVMHKGIDLDVVSRILFNLKSASIQTYVYVLFGTPYESEHQARQTLLFVKRHADAIGFINPAIFNMPAESDETRRFVTRPFSEGDLSLYVDFEHPTGWDRLSVRHFLDREFKRDSDVSKILRRTPKVFTSNHAPFFAIFGRHEC